LFAEPGLVAVEVERETGGPLQVLWAEGDAFSGEDQAARPVSWPWPAPTATIVDALGVAYPAELRDGRLALAVGVTPLLVTA
jgi:hypothetical protein